MQTSNYAKVTVPVDRKIVPEVYFFFDDRNQASTSEAVANAMRVAEEHDGAVVSLFRAPRVQGKGPWQKLPVVGISRGGDRPWLHVVPRSDDRPRTPSPYAPRAEMAVAGFDAEDGR